MDPKASSVSATSGRAGDLPDFKHPPVNETVLSIQFAPIPDFGIPHFGLYWSRIKAQFPRFQVVPELASIQEQFGNPVQALSRLGIEGLQLVTEPEVRCWFLDDSRTRLIQIQRDRLIHNWRQVEGNEEYPRYPKVRATFYEEWQRFRRFLADESLAQPQVNQCEVTYVNHLEYERGWSGYGELSKAIAFWSGKGADGFLPSPERVGIDAHYCLPSESGRLHIAMVPILRARNSKQMLQLQITARGAPKGTDDDAIFAWLDLGREWVVRGFSDFTSANMHKLWGRQK